MKVLGDINGHDTCSVRNVVVNTFLCFTFPMENASKTAWPVILILNERKMLPLSVSWII